MEYVYAALLLHRLGKPIDEVGVKKVIEAAGGSIDDFKVKALVAALQGVNIDEAIRSATVLPAAPAAAAPTAPAAPKEEKPEEKKEEKREEDALAGLSALFG